MNWHNRDCTRCARDGAPCIQARRTWAEEDQEMHDTRDDHPAPFPRPAPLNPLGWYEINDPWPTSGTHLRDDPAYDPS